MPNASARTSRRWCPDYQNYVLEIESVRLRIGSISAHLVGTPVDVVVAHGGWSSNAISDNILPLVSSRQVPTSAPWLWQPKVAHLLWIQRFCTLIHSRDPLSTSSNNDWKRSTNHLHQLLQYLLIQPNPSLLVPHSAYFSPFISPPFPFHLKTIPKPTDGTKKKKNLHLFTWYVDNANWKLTQHKR